MSERRVYAGALARFDERRNTSAFREPPPGSAQKLLEHLARCHDEEWYRWPVDGQVPLSVEEYRARGGKHA